jgi:hypothetical protein
MSHDRRNCDNCELNGRFRASDATPSKDIMNRVKDSRAFYVFQSAQNALLQIVLDVHRLSDCSFTEAPALKTTCMRAAIEFTSWTTHALVDLPFPD